MSSQNCSICGRNKSAPGTGSFTQWLSVCRCDGLDDNPNPNQKTQLPVVVCMTCGKEIRKASTGSFTQWVFSARTCECEKPIPIPASREKKAPEHGKSIEIDLNIEPEKFPVDRYEPLRRLGAGGFATVTLCHDKRLNKQVAVKVLRVASDDQLVAFQTEAKVLAKLRHSNIVSILDFGVTAHGAPYMVLEHAEGTPFDQVLSEIGHIEQVDVLALGVEIVDALSYAHEHGIFHRDVKTANILLAAKPSGHLSPLLIDFGIAFLRDGLKQNIAFQGQTLIGTPFYMSPDQLLGRRFDARSEIYSVGCLLYEMLSGKLPFHASDSLSILEMHASSPVPRFSDICPEINIRTEMQNIVYKCLEKDPDQRFQSMKDLCRALREVQFATTIIHIQKGVNKTVDKKWSWALASVLTLAILGSATFWYMDNLARSGQEVGPKEFTKSLAFDKKLMSQDTAEKISKGIDKLSVARDETQDFDADGSFYESIAKTGTAVISTQGEKAKSNELSFNFDEEELKDPALKRVLEQYPSLNRAFTGDRIAAFHESPMGDMWTSDHDFLELLPRLKALWGDIDMVPVFESETVYEYIKDPSNWLPVHGKPKCDARFKINPQVRRLVSDRRFRSLAIDEKFQRVMSDRRLQDYIANLENYRLLHVYFIDVQNSAKLRE